MIHIIGSSVKRSVWQGGRRDIQISESFISSEGIKVQVRLVNPVNFGRTGYDNVKISIWRVVGADPYYQVILAFVDGFC